MTPFDGAERDPSTIALLPYATDCAVAIDGSTPWHHGSGLPDAWTAHNAKRAYVLAPDVCELL